METKMEELETTPHPLTLDGGWEQQVREKAKREAARREMDKKKAAEEEARRRAIKRANRTMRLLCLALALITAGGILMNYIGELPLGISVSVTIGGMAMFFLVLGIMIGRRYR